MIARYNVANPDQRLQVSIFIQIRGDEKVLVRLRKDSRSARPLTPGTTLRLAVTSACLILLAFEFRSVQAGSWVLDQNLSSTASGWTYGQWSRSFDWAYMYGYFGSWLVPSTVGCDLDGSGEASGCNMGGHATFVFDWAPDPQNPNDNPPSVAFFSVTNGVGAYLEVYNFGSIVLPSCSETDGFGDQPVTTNYDWSDPDADYYDVVTYYQCSGSSIVPVVVSGSTATVVAPAASLSSSIDITGQGGNDYYWWSSYCTPASYVQELHYDDGFFGHEYFEFDGDRRQSYGFYPQDWPDTTVAFLWGGEQGRIMNPDPLGLENADPDVECTSADPVFVACVEDAIGQSQVCPPVYCLVPPTSMFNCFDWCSGIFATAYNEENGTGCN